MDRLNEKDTICDVLSPYYDILDSPVNLSRSQDNSSRLQRLDACQVVEIKGLEAFIDTPDEPGQHFAGTDLDDGIDSLRRHILHRPLPLHRTGQLVEQFLLHHGPVCQRQGGAIADDRD